MSSSSAAIEYDILAIGTDHDGCYRQCKNGEEETPYNLLQANREYADYLIDEAQKLKVKKIIGRSASRRYEMGMDLGAADQGISHFPSLMYLNDEIKKKVGSDVSCEFDNYSIEDSFYDQKDGGTVQHILSIIEKSEKKQNSYPLFYLSQAINFCSSPDDPSKFILFYADMHRLSSLNEGKRILYDIADDLDDKVHWRLIRLLKKYPVFIPPNMTLRFRRKIDGGSGTIIETLTGDSKNEIDKNYRYNIKKIFQLRTKKSEEKYSGSR